MAKPLTFIVNGKSFSLEPVKLDRKKLYGWKEIVAVDQNGNECIKTEVDNTGSFIIPPGAKSLGNLDGKGQWVSSSELKAVKQDGTEAEKVNSSFSSPIECSNLVSYEDMLDHVITSVYNFVNCDEESELVKLLAEKDGVYSFPFSYRDSYDASTGFLVENGEDVFMLIGKPCPAEFIGLNEAADLANEEDDEEQDDDLDFSMM